MKPLTVKDLIASLQTLPGDTPIKDSSWYGLKPMVYWDPFFVGLDREGRRCLFVDSGEASTCSLMEWEPLALVTP